VFFVKDELQSLRQMDPNLNSTKAIKLAAPKWALMTELEKAPYEARAAQDKIRFEE